MRIRNARVQLELRERKAGAGTALLLLHELYGSSRDWGEEVNAWPGAVWALEFSGHGASEWVRGGAYSPELLLGDADAALAAIGPSALLGKGVGAYVALLLAGARRDEIPAALLLPGGGLAGGEMRPDVAAPPFASYLTSEPVRSDGADPHLRVLDSDPRPPEYAERFAKAARRLLLVEDGAARPPWWEAARRSSKAVPVDADPAGLVTALLGATR